MSHTKLVAEKLEVTPRHARRLIGEHDERALAVLSEADPVGLAIRQAVEALHGLLDWHPTITSNCALAVAQHEGRLAHLPVEAHRLIKRAMDASLAIQNAAWAAVVPWHELDCATIRTGKLADKYETATSAGTETKHKRQRGT